MNTGKLRSWINRRSAVVTVLMLVVVAGVAAVLVRMLRPAPIPVTYAYYYDLGTEQLFVDVGGRVPPFPAPSGKTGPRGEPLGVQAYVFSCGDCDDPAKRFVGYLSQYTPRAQQQIEEMLSDPDHSPRYSMEEDPRNVGKVVRAPGGGDWFFANTEGADEVTAAGRTRCPGGGLPSPCFPTR